MNKQQYLENFIEKLNEAQFVVSCDDKEYSYNEGIDALVAVFMGYRNSGGKIFFIGNGGSAAIASHMTADYMKNGGLNTVSLYDSAVMTCIGNDYGYEQIFSKPLSFLAGERDLLVAISSSGQSKNIINAIETMREKGGKCFSLTGFDADNPVRQNADYSLYIPCHSYGIVESAHNLILQQIVDEIMERIE